MSARLVLIAGLVSLVAGCGSPSANTTVPQTEATVRVQDNEFNRTAVTIHAGGTVTWQWVGTDYHNVTFKTLTNAPGDTVQSPIQPWGTYQHTFPTAGTFDYYCIVHGGAMSGTVNVVP